MLEILLILMFLIGASKAKPKRKFRAYIKGRINQFLALTTLGAKTLTSDAIDDSVDELTFISSVVLTWSLQNFTIGTDDGPITVGVAHSDYTDAEIEAFVELNTNWSRGDKIAQEVGRRQVKIVGTFEQPTATQQASVLNDGRPIHTKCKWMLTTGQTIRYWAYNQGASPLATTIPVLNVTGHANLWPR